ncbi:hypothetical protein QYH69_17420 [Paraburkholderia sp. SARCC-3016]|uniref:hypothetical protein n=1 Tax=Paraburkholderia sp. SARCC-3016 TaxID=3058611 RepID=UPI00280898E7|nr:hypothetical protein [Paraburkholderia sp. SARCC-3016]MDQ7979032.1 hypothetical protein [Paraburkholderia sp. SARCC-3016]
MKRHIIANIWRAAVGVAAAAALSGCAGLHGQPNGPGDCVGPPGFCDPYFGANALGPDMKPAFVYAAFHAVPQQARAAASGPV